MQMERPFFSLRLHSDSFEVIADHTAFFTLPVRCAVPANGNADSGEGALTLSVQEDGDCTTAIWCSTSGCWQKKEYLLRIYPSYFTFSIRLHGAGRPDTITWFEGAENSRRPGAAYDAAGYLYPQPRQGTLHQRFTMAEDADISAQLMVPPPLCFPFFALRPDVWVGLGLTAAPGAWNFDVFSFRNRQGRFMLETPLYGKTAVNGCWETPAIVGCFGTSEWAVLQAYAAFHYERQGCVHNTEDAAWWHGPLFCGWGEQAMLAKKHGTDIFGAARQSVYAEMSAHLDALGLHPTALIVDDKWQKAYGEALPDAEKWPDLAAFADAEHQKGRRVVLWFRSWSCEGLPEDECILENGKPIAADPTNPRYQERMRRTIHQLLSEETGCFHCDGFKIDFADCYPRGGAFQTAEPDVCGIELIHRLIEWIYRCAKEAKPDALINVSGCHPYFAQYTNMARLHDYDMRLRGIEQVMPFRAKLYQAMLPGTLIDTDFPAFGVYRDAMTYLRLAPTLGVPDLYRLTGSDECPFTDSDWAEVRALWADYTARLNTPANQ